MKRIISKSVIARRQSRRSNPFSNSCSLDYHAFSAKKLAMTICAFLLFILSTQSFAKPIIADLSMHKIEIESDFKGIELLLFGARNDIGDIILVVRSPKQNFTLRKKANIGGVWINSEEVKLENIPDFYYVASSRPLKDIKYNDIKRKLGIGLDNVAFNVVKKKKVTDINEFKNAFFRLREEKKLYPKKEAEVSFMEDVLFRVKIPFPDTILNGDYVAEVYLLSDDEITGVQFVPIRIEKVGFGAFVYNLAHDYSALYGFLAVLIAVSVGWVVATIFHRI